MSSPGRCLEATFMFGKTSIMCVIFFFYHTILQLWRAKPSEPVNKSCVKCRHSPSITLDLLWLLFSSLLQLLIFTLIPLSSENEHIDFNLVEPRGVFDLCWRHTAKQCFDEQVSLLFESISLPSTWTREHPKSGGVGVVFIQHLDTVWIILYG